MTEEIERFIMIFLAVVVILLGGWFYYSIAKIKSTEMRLLDCKSKISQLRLDSIEEKKRYENARKQADARMQDIKEKARKILDENVPENCDDAIKWGISEARTFN